MTILIVLVGLLISHFATGFKRLRRFGWLLWPISTLRRQFPDRTWMPMAGVLLVALLVAWISTAVATALLGIIGWAVLALATFIFTLGPRDLDHDVALVRDPSSERQPGQADAAFKAMRLQPDDSAAARAAAVFHAAMSRWFGVLFWFVLLGIPGALLYRLNRVALQIEDLNAAEVDWLARLRLVLDWPVLALTALSIALCSDLDRVHRVWREHAHAQSRWLLTPLLLNRIAAALVPADADQDAGLALGHQWVWRVLVLWLVALSVLLLAGWLA